MSPQLVDYVTELAEGYAERLGADLCSFARHARRNTVSTGSRRKLLHCIRVRGARLAGARSG